MSRANQAMGLVFSSRDSARALREEIREQGARQVKRMIAEWEGRSAGLPRAAASHAVIPLDEPLGEPLAPPICTGAGVPPSVSEAQQRGYKKARPAWARRAIRQLDKLARAAVGLWVRERGQ
jgi:hypothetical protein